jgi:hypothetical protein
LYYRK